MDPIDLFRLFRRAVRASQLYPADGPVRQDAARALQQGMVQAIGSRIEGVSLSFLEEGVYVEGHPVKQEAEEGAVALARQVYEVGIRELRFLPGLGQGEILRFLDPLARALLGYLNPVDEDLSVLLWEADLRFIGYQLYEEPPESQAPLDGPSSCASDPYFQEYVDEDLAIGGTEVHALLAKLDEQEKLGLLTRYRREEEEEIPRKYARLVLELLRSEADPAVSKQFLDGLLEFLLTLAAIGRFSLLDAIRALVDPARAVSSLEEAALLRIREWFERIPYVDHLLGTFPRSDADEAAAAGMLRSIPAAGVPDLLARALGMDPPPKRSLSVVLDRLPVDPQARCACLRDGRPVIRRAALEAFLRESHVPSQDPSQDALLLREFMQDSEFQVRCRVVLALRGNSSPAARSALLNAMQDTHEEVRTSAAAALAVRGEKTALEPLLRVLLSRDFDHRSHAEKRAFFTAAGRLAPKEVWPVLARTVERRSWLSGRDLRERREAALEALTLLGPEAKAFLDRRWRERRPDLMRRLEAA